MASDPCAAVAELFAVPGAFVSSEPHGSGHIHDTYLATYAHRAAERHVILQRLNTGVFPDTERLMANIQAVTATLRTGLAQRPDAARRALQLIPAASGECFVVGPAGDHWRCFAFVDDSASFDIADTPERARGAARAFGEFAARLSSYRGPRLHETIAGFHDTPLRLRALDCAAKEDSLRRRSHADPEWRRVLELAPIAPLLTVALDRGGVPERIAHNDAKINNVLFDARTGEALCVIDLDTTMPGTVLSDFGDLVRTATCRAPEDCVDLHRVTMSAELYRAVLDGYLEGAAPILGEAERALMPTAGVVIAFETGVRFLTDHLLGDRYFHVTHPEQNLDRARCQLHLALDIARQLRVGLD